MISRRTHGRMAWMASAALLFGAAAFAQANSSAQPNGQMGTQGGTGTQSAADSANSMGAAGTASAGDRHFVQEATESNNAEISLGKLAQQKSSSDDVKQFGERMVTDHTNLNQQMQPVAQQMGVTVSPEQMPPKDQALQTKLDGLNGGAFDKAYIRAMVKEHREDVKKFKHEIAATKDPTLKQTVQQGLQVIEQHLQLAEQLAQAHHVSAGRAAQASSGQ